MDRRAAGSSAIIELTGRELTLLKEFLAALKQERDAIISFSLEGIIVGNNRKEEILKRLDFLEKEKEKLAGKVAAKGTEEEGALPSALRRDIDATATQVKIYMEKNMRLLSFSMDHVKSTIERIIRFINKTSYGRKDGTISFVVSRNV